MQSKTFFPGLGLILVAIVALQLYSPSGAGESVATNVDAAGAATLISERPEAIVLDVRTPGEFADGHIKGAINVDYRSDSFRTELAKLDRDATYIVHCRSGGRSGSAVPILSELGFNSIIHLDGGILGWEKAGLETVTD